MDTNELLTNLRSWYPKLSFKVDNNRLYVNNTKLCVLGDTNENVSNGVVDFIKNQIKELMSEMAKENINTLVNIDTIGKLKKTITTVPDNYSIIGNCVDRFGNWYNYPCYLAKTPGDNNMMTMQLKPVDENQISEEIEKFRKGAEKIAEELYHMTGHDYKDWIEIEIMKLIGK